MYLEAAIKSITCGDKPVKVLDLCAAPGGKSTHLLSVLPEGSVLVSNEVISSRNKILQQNMTRWGVTTSIITQNDPADFNRLPGYFDIVVVDAPCSGEGLFRKDQAATSEWSENAVNRCAVRQTVILSDVIECLKQDGFLIYSTCTFEPSENDRQVERLIRDFDFEKVSLPFYDGVQVTGFGMQFYPHRVKGEGFYLAILKKKNAVKGNINFGKPDFTSKYTKVTDPWLKNPADFLIYAKESALYAVPQFMKQDFILLMKNLYVRQAGVHLGQVMKQELVPSHQLALSLSLNNNIPRVSLALEQALAYLRCDAISLPGLDRGWHIADFEGHALGWIKALGNRINNYYPKDLRILMKG
jgi:NOL1/NOP2/fmu family ribosome biogenesis protein/predicted O-methyltransferase YrrM